METSQGIKHHEPRNSCAVDQKPREAPEGRAPLQSALQSEKDIPY